MKASLLILCAPLILADTGAAQSAESPVERGRYLLSITGCNDCHTPGSARAQGQMPETAWLTGNSLGFPVLGGTTYAINLRQYFSRITEAQWIDAARKMVARPPMLPPVSGPCAKRICTRCTGSFIRWAAPTIRCRAISRPG